MMLLILHNSLTPDQELPKIVIQYSEQILSGKYRHLARVNFDSKKGNLLYPKVKVRKILQS